MQILLFKFEDAEAVAAIIHKALLEVNSTDYSPGIIRSMVEEFTPQALRDSASKRDMFVAKQNGEVIGTISLDGDKVLPCLWSRPATAMALVEH
jgi:predicted N-acetyltransferase YhbS